MPLIRPQLPPTAALLTGVVVAISLIDVPARAEVTLPDCPAMTGWAAGYDKKAKWQPNDLGSRHWFPAIFAAPETTALFGKPVLEWNSDEAKAVAKALQACEKTLTQEKRYTERNAVSDLRSWASRNVANYIEKAGKARAEFAEAFAALAQEQPSPGLLLFYAGFARLGDGREGYSAANQAASQLSGTAQASARAALAAARDLPQVELRDRIAPEAAKRTEATRGAVRDRLLADIAHIPASLPGLDALGGLRRTLAKDYAAVFPPADRQAVSDAIGHREAAVGKEIADQMIADINGAIDGMPAFNNIAVQTNPQLLKRLPPAEAARVRSAADAKAERVAEALLPIFERTLADLAVSDESVDALEGPILADIRQSMASAPSVRSRFEEAAAARRAEIVAALTKAEAGPLRGRHYADPKIGMKLEFVDRERVFVTTPDGQTAAGTYTEEKDGRVVITLPGSSTVLTREGGRLIGGPIALRRVEPAR